MEKVPDENNTQTANERAAVTHYWDAYQRLPSGRYSVCLPRCLRDKQPLADSDFGGPGQIDVLLGMPDISRQG